MTLFTVKPPRCNAGQVVTVEFRRTETSKPGVARHPWYWIIIIPGAYNAHISPDSFTTLGAAVEDFRIQGVMLVSEIETNLAQTYAAPLPYDLNTSNPVAHIDENPLP